jgi:hypothetical protein
MDDTIRLEPSEDAILHDDVSDETLERAAAPAQARSANPTVPSAIICIPFETP